MDSNKTPSEIIAELCVEAGISKSELARRLEITPSQITRILNGDTKTISSDILIKLTKLFGVSADYLLGITDKKEIIKEKHTTRVPMLLMSSAFPLGRCIEFIESIDDVPQKEMAYAEMYLNCEDIMLKLSASLIYTFANLSLDRIHSARFGLERLKEYLKEAMLEETDKKTRACCVFVATAAHTLLHIPVGDLPPLAEYLSEFTKGMQLWGAYVLAHKAYLVKDYQRSLGIVQTCLMTCSKVYPIAMIYLNLVVAMDLMNLKETDKAKVYFMKVWEISRPDNLIEGIGEHHGLLQGLIEACMKKDYPEDYARIIDITYKFSAGWRRIHNPDTNEDVADNLTTTEFTIAMLANRGWTNKEISEYLEITPRTVKQHLTCVFNKLNIENRKQLKNFMLR